MYNKIFTKILDSSIWLESNETRLVWMTLLAAMDETGFAQFASVANLAHRARIELSAAEAAVKCLESADTNSSDPDHEGRRIERVAGGWIVLNAEKYRALVTRAVAQEKTRERVARFREKKRSETNSNADVTPANVSVTPSEALAETDTSMQVAGAPAADVPKDPKPARTPTLAEWTEKCHVEHPDWPQTNAESAWRHYESVGWRKGKSPIVKWQQCVATCYRNWKDRGFGERTFGQPVSAYPMPKLAN